MTAKYTSRDNDTREKGTHVSSDLPPWLLSIIPSAPYSTAMRASATVCTPLSTTGSPDARLIQAMSSQTRLLSMYWAMSLPRPPPFLSLVDAAPEMADRTVVAAATRSSASRFPGTGASTVTKMALIPAFATLASSSAVLARSELTYSWKKKGRAGSPDSTMLPSGYEALLEIF